MVVNRLESGLSVFFDEKDIALLHQGCERIIFQTDIVVNAASSISDLSCFSDDDRKKMSCDIVILKERLDLFKCLQNECKDFLLKYVSNLNNV